MAKKPYKKYRHNYKHFDNPRDEDYLAAEELCPRDGSLTDDELKIWSRLMPYLNKLSRLKPWYLDLYIEYCRTVAKINSLTLYLIEHGDTYESSTRDGKQIKNRPEVGQLNVCRRMLRSFGIDNGLNPAAEKQNRTAAQEGIENAFGLIEQIASEKEEHADKRKIRMVR